MKHEAINFSFIRISACLLLAVGISSCEKVISVNLNRTNPQIVITGIVTDQPGPDSVFVSETGNYFDPSLSFPAVSGAMVTLSDGSGLTDTLNETAGGIYVTNGIWGKPGRTYTLAVQANGTMYQGISTMPARVSIDTLYAQPLLERDGDRGYYVHLVFRDPPEPGNYYCIRVFTDKEPGDSVTGQRYILTDDKITNGNEINYQIRAGRNNVHAGDTLTVELLSIDKATYDYYSTLNDILGTDRSPTSLSPANPTTNLTNGSLGYFAAFTIDRVHMVLR